jgi:hypothetical protein
MAEGPLSNEEIQNQEHIDFLKTGDNIAAKKVALYGYYPGGSEWTRLQTDANGVVQTSGSGGGGGGGTQYQELAVTSPATGTLALGRYQTSLPTLTNGEMNEPMLDATSTLLVNSPTLATAANQTNGNQLAKITDGTNTANVVAGDTGFNGVATAGASKQITFTTSTSGAQTLGPWNVEGYAWIEVNFSSVGVGLALLSQFAPTTGGTYFTANTFSSTTGVPSGSVGTTANITYVSVIRGNSFQLAVSTLTSGTVTGTVTLRTTPEITTLNVGQAGTWTVSNSPQVTLAGTGTITSASSSITSTTASSYGGYASISINGTYSGVSFGITTSDNSGTNFYNTWVYSQTTGTWLPPGTTITPGTNASGVYWVPIYANTFQIKVLATAWSTGTANVRIIAGQTNQPGSTMAQIFSGLGNTLLEANTASNSAGTGLLGVGNLGYDGTNWQIIGAADANSATTGINGASVLTAGTGYTTSTITLNSSTPNTGWYDMLNYPWISVEVLTNTTPATLTWQTSGDSAQTNTSGLLLAASTGNGGVATTTSATGTFVGARGGRYFRIASNNGAGTTTLVITFFTTPSPYNVTSQINGNIGSSAATGSAVPAGAFYLGINSGGNLSGVSQSTNGDGATPGNMVATGSNLFNYNGSTFDRQRNNTTGVVVAAGQTSTTTQTLTTYNARSLLLAVNIASGAGTVTVAISGSTSSGYTYPILTSTALTGVADNTLRVFPGATPATNTTANDILPRTLSITYTVVGTIAFGSDYVLSV